MLLKVVLVILFIYLIVLILLNVKTELETTFNFSQDIEHFNATLAQLLKPRYPGSFGHEQVIVYLMDELKKLGFGVISDKFYLEAHFTNVMGIWNEKAKEMLVLSCHYDSQSPREGENETYLGATDGAVPCAIILNVVKTLGPYLRSSLRSQTDLGILVSIARNSLIIKT